MYLLSLFRGESFRHALTRIGEIRSLVPEGVNLLAMTATASTALRVDIAKMLGMKEEIVVSIPPCKVNIMYATGIFKSVQLTFSPMLKKLQEQRAVYPRTIVYCQRLQECADVYHFFKSNLGTNFTDPVGAPDIPTFRLVDMFLSCTDEVVKAQCSLKNHVFVLLLPLWHLVWVLIALMFAK